VYDILVQWERADLRVDVKFTTMFVARRDSAYS
jgi:hypothetical protein